MRDNLISEKERSNPLFLNIGWSTYSCTELMTLDPTATSTALLRPIAMSATRTWGKREMMKPPLGMKLIKQARALQRIGKSTRRTMNRTKLANALMTREQHVCQKKGDQ
jgi:hypothetical protein